MNGESSLGIVTILEPVFTTSELPVGDPWPSGL